jgi:hypothetical protein
MITGNLQTATRNRMVGIVLFLAWEEKRPFLAGASLLLPFAKPHLLVFFWLAFLICGVSGFIARQPA